MPKQWGPLMPGPFQRSAKHAGTDPMWVWADATGYRDFGEAVHSDLRLWCVFEHGGDFVCAQCTPDDADKFKAAELSMPVAPQRARPPMPDGRAPTRAGKVMLSSPPRVLVGVIDSGCPFAADFLRDPATGGTRVLGLWDQDSAPAFKVKGFLPTGFTYGRAIDRAGLDAHIRNATRAGVLDEEACYHSAGYTAVRSHLSHGGAVLSQLFARSVYGGALQAEPAPAAGKDRTTPAIDQADLVFVQLSRAAVQDASSAGLARDVIDGLRFILAHAVRGQRVVVNISSGTSRTGHEGKSLIERALQQAVKQAGKQNIDLTLVLPAGNTNMAQRHAVLSSAKSHLELFLPPGCESPQFVTVRWPPGAAGVTLCLTPPGGSPQAVRFGEAFGLFDASRPTCGVIMPPAKGQGEAAISLLAFAPTESADPHCPLAPSGRWRIDLQFDQPDRTIDPVKFWISRNQCNPGALRRGRQADFVDWDRRHHPQAWLRFDEDDRAGDGISNGIRRDGALSGLATARIGSEKIVTVGSTFVLDRARRPSPYSAGVAGPVPLPDCSAPGDVSRALRGLSVRGNHGGEVVRVVGTSFSAPLVARALVNEQALGTVPRPRRRRQGSVIPSP